MFMRKNNLKRLLFFGIVFILFGCSEDFYETENYDSGLIFKLLSREQILANQKLTLKINEVERTNSQIQGKIVYDTIYNFTINTNSATYINNLGIETYTFEVQRTLGDGKLENLVIREKPNGEFDSFLVKYGFTIEQKLLENFNPNQYLNPIYTLIDFDYQILLTGRCIYTSTVECEEIWSVNCSTVPPRQGESDGGGSIEQVESCSWTMSIGNCMVNLNESCTGGGGDFGGATTSPHSSGGGSNTFPDTPCGRLQKGTSSLAYKTKFKNLTTKYDAQQESGFGEIISNGVKSYQNLSAIGGKELIPVANMLNFTHVHNNHEIIDDAGNKIDITVKILSPADIMSLINICQPANYQTSSTDAFAVMLSDEGHFALTILEPIPYSFLQSQQWKDFKVDFFKQISKITGDINGSPQERNRKLQKMMLSLLKNAGLENKIGLFEGEIETDLNEINLNWTRKTLDPNSTPNNLIVVPNPC